MLLRASTAAVRGAAAAALALSRPRAQLLSTLRDTVVRSVVERALDQAIAADLAPQRPATHAQTPLARDAASSSFPASGSSGTPVTRFTTAGGESTPFDSVEPNALTWKSVVVRGTRGVVEWMP